MLPSQFTVEEGGWLLAIDVNRWIPAIVFVFVVEHMCKLKKSIGCICVPRMVMNKDAVVDMVWM